MKKLIDFEIVNHGPEYSDYFQGCGTAFTKYDMAVTGIGDNAKAAYDDAVEQLYQMDIEPASLDRKIPKRPHGIRARDSVKASAGYDCSWHVSIRVELA